MLRSIDMESSRYSRVLKSSTSRRYPLPSGLLLNGLRTWGIVAALFLVLSALPGTLPAFGGEPTYLTVQLASEASRAEALASLAVLDRNTSKEVSDLLRIERVGDYFSLRMGDYTDEAQASAALQQVLKLAPDALIIHARILPHRLIIAPRTRLNPPSKPVN